ncbi:MAG: hypothetical protein QJR02_08410 [Sinobacteraceae bacterium]|nr:hypothetical protein [Nevskiaceae bacterium]
MTTGLKIKLPVAFTDTSLPILYDDALMSAGTLMLADPMHSAAPWAAGVPAANAPLPNIAWSAAAALIGSGDQTSLGPIFLLDNVASNEAKLERSSKGGLHVIWTQANASSKRAALFLPNPIQNYLINNPRHKYYFSLWQRVTRAPKNILEVPEVAILSGSPALSNYLVYYSQRGALPNSSNPVFLGGRDNLGGYGVGNKIVTIGANGFTGAAPTATSQTNNYELCCWGYGDAAYSPTSAPNSRSSIFYRVFLEDLTVSGRGYADVDAIDYGLWQAAFAPGGRYYNDTFTDPATFA